MKNKKNMKRIVIIALCTMVITGGYFGVKNFVYGADDLTQYVTGEVQDINVVLTTQNQSDQLTVRTAPTATPIVTASPVPTDASGATASPATETAIPIPSATPIPLPEMPQSVGGYDTKYSEENPFMVLEIVPDLTEQVLAWMDADSAPISDYELSHRLAMVNKNNIKNVYQNCPSDVKPLFEYSNFKVWNTKIDVDDITLGGDGLSIRQKVAQISNDSSLTDAKKKEDIEKYVEEKCYITMPFYSVEKKFEIESADAIGSGADFAGIEEKYIKDTYNWTTETTSKTKKKSGYLVKTGTGAGKFKPDTWNKTVYTSQNQNENGFCWSFSETLPTGECIDSKLTDQNYLNNNVNSLANGAYFTITDWNMPVCKYTYYNLVNNDLLKDALLNPYDDINHTTLKNATQIKEELKHKFVVVTTTAAQVNELAKYDTADTLDYIERCDMLYLNSLNPNTDNQQFMVTKFYNCYVDSYRETVNADGSVTATANPDEDKLITASNYPSYRTSGDIEWSVCMKIIKKLSIYVDFPMLINSTLYNVCSTESISNNLYKDQNNAWQPGSAQASLTNASKIFHIASEFNLLARRTSLPEELSEDEKDTYINFFKNIKGVYSDEGIYQGKRTFMDDIYPKIKQIKLATPNGNCEYTGYYERPETDAYSKNCILWTEYTFFPVGITYNKQKKENEKVVNDGNSEIRLMQSAGCTLEMQTQLGYLETFAFNEGSGSFTTESNPTNRDKFYGTDADRSTLEKHYQNVVGQPVNQSLFTTDGFPFWKIFSSLREIVIKPKMSAAAMQVKIKKVNFSSDKYVKYIDVDVNAPDDYDDNDIVDIQFSVTNPAGNDNAGYFMVHRLPEGLDDKDSQYYEDPKNTGGAYLSDSVYQIQEITSKTGASAGEPVKITGDSYATESMVGYKIEAGETKEFRIAYRLTDYLGTSAEANGTKYSEVLFSTRVVRNKYSDAAKTNLIEWSLPKTKYTKLLLKPIDLFNLE